MLDFIAEAQLGIVFNNLENAAVALDSLLLHNQNELGAETSIGLAALQGLNYLNSGLFSGALGADFVLSFKRPASYSDIFYIRNNVIFEWQHVLHSM